MNDLQPIAPPDPPLRDGVVALRPLVPEDALTFHEHHRDEGVQAYMSIIASQSLEASARFVVSHAAAMRDGTSATFAITRARTREVIGSIGVDRSLDDPGIGTISYWMFTEARGRGLMTRAVDLLTPWAFAEMGLARLQIEIHPANIASQRVALKAGFRAEGLLRSIAEQHGHRVNLFMFSRIAEDPPLEDASR